LGRRTFRKADGVNPTRAAGPDDRLLSWSEREEIAALDHAGHGVREIARRLERNPSTVSRELDRGATSCGYRASVGQFRADRGPAAPGGSKLARNLLLRKEVQGDSKRREIPEQIAGRLKTEFP
jgi:IS30 family transposase